jgi:HD-like signal output (HDOD) protein
MAAAPIYEENPKVAALMSRVSELAVLPHVVYKVLELSGSADSSTVEMERAIVVDPGFSSRILTMANSAYYGLPKKVTSIKEALLFLGFKAIRQLAMTVGVYDMFVGKTDKDSLRRRAWWRHSVDSAVCAKWLASEFKIIPSEDAYTCGLLHCLGKTLLDRFGGQDYSQIEMMVQNGMTLIDSERQIFGCIHIEVAQIAAKKWGFPEELVNGLDYLSLPRPDEPYLMHRAVVCLASQIADYAMAGGSGVEIEEEHTLCAWALAAIGLSDERQADCMAGGMRAIAAAAQLQV